MRFLVKIHISFIHTLLPGVKMLPGLVLHLDSSPFQVLVLPMARKSFHQQHFRPFLLPVASFLRHRQHPPMNSRMIRAFSRRYVTPSGGLFRIHQPGGFLITDPYDTGQLMCVGRETEPQLPEDFRFLAVPKFSE